jgi:hypothetical protein
MSNMSKNTGNGFKAGQVKRALLHGMPVESKNGWIIRINDDDAVEVWPPKGEGFSTHIGLLDKAVADFCKKADMPIPGVNVHPKDQVSVGAPDALLGKDSGEGEGFDNPKVNERPGGLDAEGTSAPDTDLGPDTSSDSPSHFDPELNLRPTEPRGIGGLPDPDLGMDSSGRETNWGDEVIEGGKPRQVSSGRRRSQMEPKKPEDWTLPEPKNAYNYEVIVGNIGTVYSGDDVREAVKTYSEYKEQSETGQGRASGESVTLVCDDEIWMEHPGDGREAQRQVSSGRRQAVPLPREDRGKGQRLSGFSDMLQQELADRGSAIKVEDKGDGTALVYDYNFDVIVDPFLALSEIQAVNSDDDSAIWDALNNATSDIALTAARRRARMEAARRRSFHPAQEPQRGPGQVEPESMSDGAFKGKGKPGDVEDPTFEGNPHVKDAFHAPQKGKRGPGQLGVGKAQMGPEAPAAAMGVAARRRADSDPFKVTPVEEPGKHPNKGETPSDPDEVVSTSYSKPREEKYETEGETDKIGGREEHDGAFQDETGKWTTEEDEKNVPEDWEGMAQQPKQKAGRIVDTYLDPTPDPRDIYRALTAKRPSTALLEDIMDESKWAANNVFTPARGAQSHKWSPEETPNDQGKMSENRGRGTVRRKLKPAASKKVAVHVPEDQVEYSVRVEPDDSPVDRAMDPEAIKWVEDQLAEGNEWAWCEAQVIAKWKDSTGLTYQGESGWLSGCAYYNEEDFKKGGYYEQMQQEAYEDLVSKVEDADTGMKGIRPRGARRQTAGTSFIYQQVKGMNPEWLDEKIEESDGDPDELGRLFETEFPGASMEDYVTVAEEILESGGPTEEMEGFERMVGRREAAFVSNSDIDEWVLNDESLYNWAMESVPVDEIGDDTSKKYLRWRSKNRQELAQTVRSLTGSRQADAPTGKGWERVTKELKKEKDVDNPFALANWMKGQGYKPKEQGGGKKDSGRRQTRASNPFEPFGDEREFVKALVDEMYSYWNRLSLNKKNRVMEDAGLSSLDSDEWGPDDWKTFRGWYEENAGSSSKALGASRRQAGPKIKEEWRSDGGYSRGLESESAEELHAMVQALGGEEVDWSR